MFQPRRQSLSPPFSRPLWLYALVLWPSCDHSPLLFLPLPSVLIASAVNGSVPTTATAAAPHSAAAWLHDIARHESNEPGANDDSGAPTRSRSRRTTYNAADMPGMTPSGKGRRVGGGAVVVFTNAPTDYRPQWLVEAKRIRITHSTSQT